MRGRSSPRLALTWHTCWRTSLYYKHVWIIWMISLNLKISLKQTKTHHALHGEREAFPSAFLVTHRPPSSCVFWTLPICWIIRRLADSGGVLTSAESLTAPGLSDMKVGATAEGEKVMRIALTGWKWRSFILRVDDRFNAGFQLIYPQFHWRCFTFFICSLQNLNIVVPLLCVSYYQWNLYS